jgi:hypothetical protein
MAKRKAAKGKSTPTTAPQATSETVDDRLMAFAEVLGRTAGTIHGRAEGLVDPAKLTGQLAAVRDGAAHLIEQIGKLTPGFRKKPVAKGRAVAKGRSGGTVDAPGKKHRAPMPADPRARKAASHMQKVRDARTPVTATRRRSRAG